MYNYVYFFQILHNVDSALLAFADMLIPCLEKCVHLKSKTASRHAAKVSDIDNAKLTLIFMHIL